MYLLIYAIDMLFNYLFINLWFIYLIIYLFILIF